MKFIADLQIHSQHSRATSPRMNLEVLDEAARRKGILVMGTGDATHPLWVKELKEKLELAETGLYRVKGLSPSRGFARFLLTAEVSLIYKRLGKVRKVHQLLFFPNFAALDDFNIQLSKVGNLMSDGRPIIGLDSEKMAKMLFNSSPDNVLIPAHCWTPWFSVFGARSGFDTLEECFGKYTDRIFAVESGLSCYDGKTDVLTADGWKGIAEVEKSDTICTLNSETESIEYQKPTKIFRYQYDGKMYKLRTKRVDLLITPNHKLFYRPCDFRTRKPYRLKEAGELYGKSKILKKDAKWEGETPGHFILPAVKVPHGSQFYSGWRTKKAKEVPIKPWLKFFGFWMAEGWVTGGKDGFYAVFVCNLEKKILDEMSKILRGFGYNVYQDKKTVRVRDFQLYHYLKQFGQSGQKFIPKDIKTLSGKLLEVFFKYYIKGDGHRYGRSGKGLSATTISTRLRDDLQEIALKMGISAYYKLHNPKGWIFSSPGQKGRVYSQSANSWNVYFIRHNMPAIIPSSMKRYHHTEEWVNFDGPVFCLDVPNDVIYVRRNGIPVWCGNSDPPMNWRLKQLDQITIVSNSDAHSPEKIGREANVFDTELSYAGIIDAIKTADPKKFLMTLEFFPEEGKYHYPGHRACKMRATPEQAKDWRGICPKCGRLLTDGVLTRVETLANYPIGHKSSRALPYKYLIPLQEIIAEALGTNVGTKAVKGLYQRLTDTVAPEFEILMNEKIEDLKAVAGGLIAEGISRVREGQVKIEPGYDGEFGHLKVFTPEERAAGGAKEMARQARLL